MNKKNLYPLIGMFILIASAAYSGEPQWIGNVKTVDLQKQEISISLAATMTAIQLGEKFYVLINDRPVFMTATFPMLSQTKCRLTPGYKDYLKQIHAGIKVYKYSHDIDAKIDYDALKAKGSIKNLVMLCGNTFNNENVRTYMKQLGDGFEPTDPASFSFSDITNSIDERRHNVEIAQHQYGYYYSYKSKGVSLKFDNVQNGFVLTEILLYNEAANNFSKYKSDLPENLSFNDTRAVVESKIGKPKESGGEGKIPFWANYSHLGFIVTYKSESVTDMNNKILSISIKRF
jgi:hypothetical protein